MIPVAGIVVATGFAAVSALTVSPTTALQVGGLFLSYHLFEAYVLIPRLYGNQLRLSTLTVLLRSSAAERPRGHPRRDPRAPSRRGVPRRGEALAGRVAAPGRRRGPRRAPRNRGRPAARQARQRCARGPPGRRVAMRLRRAARFLAAVRRPRRGPSCSWPAPPRSSCAATGSSSRWTPTPIHSWWRTPVRGRRSCRAESALRRSREEPGLERGVGGPARGRYGRRLPSRPRGPALPRVDGSRGRVVVPPAGAATHEEATPARVGRYPNIVGFPDPPRRDPGARRAATGNPWRVAVDDLRVLLVREIWIDAWRWEGKGRVSGGFLPAARHRGGGLAERARRGGRNAPLGSVLRLEGTTGHVGAALPRFETQKYPGNEVWKIMSGSASCDGTLDAVPFLAPGRWQGAGRGGREASACGSPWRTGGAAGRSRRRCTTPGPFSPCCRRGRPPGSRGSSISVIRGVRRTRTAPGFLAASPVAPRRGRFRSTRTGRRRSPRMGRAASEEGTLSLGLASAPPRRRQVTGAAEWFEEEAGPGGLRTDQPRGSAVALREIK